MFFNSSNNKTIIIITLIISFLSERITTQNDVFIIDDFTIEQNALTIEVSATNPLPISLFDFQSDTIGVSSPHIIGGERDLLLTMSSGATDSKSSSFISSNTFSSIFQGESTSGYSLLQYDGIDNTMNINITGLTAVPGASTGLNLLSSTEAAFNLTYKSDFVTSGDIYVFDILGGVSLGTVNFPPINFRESIVLPFGVFEGTCDFSKVGAIEIYIVILGEVDFQLFSFVTTSSANPPLNEA